MKQYHEILSHILEHGVRKPTRAKLVSTGKNIDALSVFGYQNRYDLSAGFPAVTTKKLFFRGVVAELLWFLRGSTNAHELQAENVHIWDQWAHEETGDVGPVYGKQWRSWACPDGSTIDQIAQAVEDIKATIANPTASVGRRLIVTAWNPADIPKMGLPSCHCFFQFSVTGDKLSCQLYQRSADAFLGVPFNIASYALLVHLMARATGLQVGEFVHTFGDLHIYENHVEQVREQLSRELYPLPTVVFKTEQRKIDGYQSKDIALDKYQCHPDIFSYKAEDISLDGYQYHPALKGEVAV